MKTTTLSEAHKKAVDAFMAEYREITEAWCIGDMMSYLDKHGIDYSHAYADRLDEAETNGIIHAVFKNAYFENWHTFAEQVYDEIFKEMWRP